MKAIHAVNTALWHPGEETQTLQTDRQTDRQTDYCNPLGAARPRVNNHERQNKNKGRYNKNCFCPQGERWSYQACSPS